MLTQLGIWVNLGLGWQFMHLAFSRVHLMLITVAGGYMSESVGWYFDVMGYQPMKYLDLRKPFLKSPPLVITCQHTAKRSHVGTGVWSWIGNLVVSPWFIFKLSFSCFLHFLLPFDHFIYFPLPSSVESISYYISPSYCRTSMCYWSRELYIKTVKTPGCPIQGRCYSLWKLSIKL